MKSAWFVGILCAITTSLADASTFRSSRDLVFTDEELARLPRTRDGRAVYTGDIIIYLDRIRPRSAIKGNRWTRGELVYRFNGQTADQQALFVQACTAWTVGTALRCIERTNQINFVNVVTHSGEGCGGFHFTSCSAVGMIGVGSQVFEVYVTHWSPGLIGVIQHEIGHALGLIHEHQRPDRDDYVIINSANIRPGAEHNFTKEDDATVLTEYDYTSSMHYSNCTFEKNSPCDPNDRGTEPNWTISPAPCALNRVGGDQITALDLDGIRGAYGGPVAALFDTGRQSACGTHQYSKDQVVKSCGAGCAMAGPVNWSRLYQKYDWGCGFLPIFNGPGFCTGRKQEFRAQWYDEDKFHIKCWGGTLVERWTECGCSAQAMTALCTDYGSNVNLTKLQALIDSTDANEKQTGQLIRHLLDFSDQGFFAAGLKSELPYVMLAAFVRGRPNETASFLCRLRAELTIRRLLNQHYQMSADLFRKLAKLHDIL